MSSIHNVKHIARAVYEGTAYSIRDALSVFEDVSPCPDLFTGVGGGVKSRIWIQTVSDVLNRPIQISEDVDSAYGTALLGWIGVGGLSFDDVIAHTHQADRVSVLPVQENVELYRLGFDRYRSATRFLLDHYADAGALPN